jgi:phosphopantetheine adenylyltransferase
MLATSFALSEAVNKAMTDDSVKATAFGLMEVHNVVPEEVFQQLLFEFAANLTAVTASLVTEVFLTEEQIQGMLAESVELMMSAKSIIDEE